MVNVKDLRVAVPEGTSGDWKVKRFTVSKDEADIYNLRCMINRRMHRRIIPGDYTNLTHGGTLVMSDTPAEIRDHSEMIWRASGQVLIHGLGLGVVVLGCLRKPEVKHVTVVEISDDVLGLVADHYRRQFNGRLTIVQGDAYAWKPLRGKRWNVVWHDIWNSICSDNWEGMKRLRRRFGGRADWQDSWCREDMRPRN